MKCLNAGCGTDIRKGWVNLDCHDTYKPEVIWDLEKFPYPFKDNEFNYIYCAGVLEHLIDTEGVINEFIRIIKPNGTIEIKVPNETDAWNSIFHKTAFSITSFDEIATNNCRNIDSYKTKYRLDVKSEFYSDFGMKGKAIAWLLNKIPRILYCGTILKYIFPAVMIRFYIKKTKEKPLPKNLMKNLAYKTMLEGNL